jgi:hypothetical protein
VRRSLILAAATTVPILVSAVLTATASSAVQASSGGNATVTSVSCTPGGTCAAGGQYVDASSRALAFVLTERNGQWGTAIEVPGLAARHAEDASISAVSCAAGGCVAAGRYQGADGRPHAFVTAEQSGRWSGLTTLSTPVRSASIGIGSLSCSGPGNCAVGGGRPAFVVSKVSGRWGRAVQFKVTGKNGRAEVSCTSPGNCTASWYTFVVRERNGHWGTPMALPGLAARTVHSNSGLGASSISCASAASCVVGGIYPHSHHGSAFVASERGGRWGKTIEVPGYLALSQGSGYGQVASVSCPSVGNCVAAGSYAAPADFAGGVYVPFVASERNGHWGKAIEVPGIPPPGNPLCEPDSSACVAGQVFSASCGSGGTCAAGGWYDTPAIAGQVAFVVIYKNGQWTKVTQIPGLTTHDATTATTVNSVACAKSGKCVAGGPGFVVDENNGTWGQAHLVLAPN